MADMPIKPLQGKARKELRKNAVSQWYWTPVKKYIQRLVLTEEVNDHKLAARAG